MIYQFLVRYIILESAANSSILGGKYLNSRYSRFGYGSIAVEYKLVKL